MYTCNVYLLMSVIMIKSCIHWEPGGNGMQYEYAL